LLGFAADELDTTAGCAAFVRCAAFGGFDTGPEVAAGFDAAGDAPALFDSCGGGGVSGFGAAASVWEGTGDPSGTPLPAGAACSEVLGCGDIDCGTDCCGSPEDEAGGSGPLGCGIAGPLFPAAAVRERDSSPKLIV
jgi:hypothetical protein